MSPTGIRNLESYGAHGWQWDWTDPYGDITRHYSTNAHGEGLWVDDRQILGLSQLSLYGTTRKQAYARLRRYYRRLTTDLGNWGGEA